MAEVRWKITADDSEARKKLQGIKKLQDDLQKQGETIIRRLKEAGSGAGKGANYKQESDSAKAAAKATEELAKARLAEAQARQFAANASKQDREAQLAFMDAIRKSRLEIQANREAQAKANADLIAGRKTLQDYRIEMAKLNLEEKKRRDAERAAKKALNENSQYQQLNKALGELRRQSKDVLAEMFLLEGQGKKNTIAYKQLADQARGLVAQTQYLDKGLKKIDASLGLHQRNVGNYRSALDALSPMFAQLNGQLAAMGINITELSGSKNVFRELGAQFAILGKQALMFLVSPIGLVITALASLYALIRGNANTVIQFNAGLLNVSKTTGIAGAQLDKLGDSLIGLSRRLEVVGTDKLLEYATVAGQLGVKGTANILAFTEALAKLETASDIQGEEGGSSIARLLTLVDGGVQNVKAFGDEIVNLGNNFAATEAEILENATQIAQNVGIYKIGRQEVLAFATATKSVGIEAELVGSTFGRTLGQFEKIIRTGKGLADLLKVVGGNEKELAQRFKTDASGVFVDYIRGLNNINKAGGSVNAALTKTGVVAIRDQRVIASLASNGFDVLTDAMNKASDAAGAMDQEFATKAASLENQLGRISTAWNNLVLSIENGQGVLGRSASWMAGQLADLLEWVNKLVTATSANEFITRFNPFSSGQASADAIRNANTALRETVDVIKQVRDVDLSNANAKALTEQISLMDGALQAAHKQIEATDKAIKEGLLKEGSGEGLKRATSDLEQLKRAAEQLLSTKPAETVSEAIDPNTEELTKEQQRAREAALKAQRDLQKQIDEMNRASLRATLDKDEQEVESVREKYRKIRETIEAFRKDPKNKGLAVDASGLSSAESREVAQVRYRQETTELVKSLGVQRELWQEYESWRLELGEESARQRYSNELSVIDNFKANIKREIASIGAQLTAALAGGPAAATLTGAESERLKQLQDLLKQITDQEQKQRDANLRRVLTDYASFETKRVRLHKQADEDMELLDEDGRKRRKKALDDELLELYRTEIEGKERFKDFMKEADTAGSSLALSAMKHARDYVETLVDKMKITPAEKARLRKEFGEFFSQGIAALEQENFGNVANLVDGFGQLVTSASEFDGTMSNALKTVGNMVNQVGQLSQTLSQTLGKAGDSLSKGGGYAAIIGAVLSVASAISEGFNQARQRANGEVQANFELQNDRQLRATEAITRALEMQLDLINEIYGADRLNKYADSLEGIKKNWQDINRQLDGRLMMTTDNFTNSILARINNGESAKSILKSFSVASSEYYQAGNILDNISRFDRLSSLPEDITEAREELAKLQYQAALGNVDDYTQKLIDQLASQIDLYDQTMNRLREENTGNAFSSILDDIKGLFRNNGADSAEAWTQSFNKILENYMMQKFSREWLDERVQDWYSVFDEFAKSDGLDEDERKELRKQWDEIQREGQGRLDEIRETLGLDNDSQSNPNTLQGAYARASQESIDLLAGQTGAMRLHLYELVKLASANNSNTVNQIDIMNGQLNALIAIERNTGVTAQHSMEYLPYLKSMDTKMGDSLGLQLRAAGKFGF